MQIKVSTETTVIDGFRDRTKSTNAKKHNSNDKNADVFTFMYENQN